MSNHREDIIYTGEAKSLHGLFRVRLSRSRHKIAYQQFNKERREWQSYSWGEIAERVAAWQERLRQQSLNSGDRVAVSLRNGVEWIAFEQAALALGLVVIPLYTDDRADNIAYIIEDAAVKCLLLQDEARWRRIAPSIPENSPLQAVFLQEGEVTTESNICPIYPVKEFDSPPPPLTHFSASPNTLATIVYTSGTTGRPKGVMLSHANILENVHVSLTMLSIYADDLFLSFLPISHMLERMGGYYLPMMTGSSVAFSRSIPQLAEDISTLQPTIMIAVPRIFERIFGRIQSRLDAGSFIKKSLFQAAVSVGWSRFLYQQGRGSWRPTLLAHPLLDRLVGSKVRAQLGGKLRLTVSGGAPLSADVARLFTGLGITLLQGYGLTETSPVISVNLPHANRPQTVGRPVAGIKT
ncbi:MAG: AMP-binding protein, partial [Gammaproteobacteria bacterium]|nr:AMP-binding protein [Gammaproteobacteria bacterium]